MPEGGPRLKTIMASLKQILNQYNYHLPPELIAQKPAKPRDSARLLVYSKTDGKIRFDTFKNIADYLPKNAVLVFNQTKVWPARLSAVKPTGGRIELLYISHDENYIRVLANKKLLINSKVSFSHAYSINSRRPELCRMGGREKSSPVSFKVVKKIGQFYYIKPSFPLSQTPKILKRYGITPLPPYIKNSPLTEKQRRAQYQSVFAKSGLSVAAPTASLHFTKPLMAKLKKRGIDIKFVRLDVNLGTFAPLREEQIKSGKLHQEFYNIDKLTAKFLNQAKKQGRPIIAVGTTVVRTLESAASVGEGFKPSPTRGKKIIPLTKLTGTTSLFIRDKYHFKFVAGLITNFHVPKSSLLMLTSAFIGRKKLLDLYQLAIIKNFRFFSFGDGMLILPVDI
jgi:S-adenosylmethionine:tRNA ribosyltransferase-isomerase